MSIKSNWPKEKAPVLAIPDKIDIAWLLHDSYDERSNTGIDDKCDYSIVDGDHDDEKDIDGNNSNGKRQRRQGQQPHDNICHFSNREIA